MMVKVRVIPHSRKSAVIDLGKSLLKVRVLSPPIDNRANNELIEVLARYYNTSKSSIKIRRGLKSRVKLVEIED
ncbi:DUF167 domain-containing protein [candidate division WOR-3 bacterium]|nr:DUF167 domain-containing protein [candidate division WOR-3 bacterium]